jgi:nucleoid-associated protein YgaU
MPARIPGVLGGQQRLARALVNAALMLLPVAVTTLAPAGQALAMTAAAPAPTAPAAARQAAAPTEAAATQQITLTVDGPRTWWDLAEQHSGDGAAWRQLWALNAGRTQTDGTTLTSERIVLRPGWTNLIPATGTPPAPVAAAGAQDPTPAAADRPGTGPVELVVQPGDTLSQLAADHDEPDWTRVWLTNADRAQPDGQRFTDPDHIEPGWEITLPAPTGTAVLIDGVLTAPADPRAGAVTVTAGDTLSQIAADHGTDVPTLLTANAGMPQPDGSTLTDPDRIEVGWQLRIPTADLPGPAADSPAPGPADIVPEPADITPDPADSPPATSDAPTDAAAVPPGIPGAADIPADPPPAAADIPPGPSTPAPTGPAAPAATDAPAGPAADNPAAPGGSDPAPQDRTLAPVAAFTGAGGVLAAVILAALVRGRRRQFRHRRPGHDLMATPDDLVAMERALLTAGSASGAVAAWRDQALHGLAHLAEQQGAAVPEVAAARLTTSTLQLVLHQPRTDAPGAWISNADGDRWTLHRSDPTGYRPERRGWVAAPFPTLATVGHTPAGEHWLIDLERVGALTLTGDRDRAVALARFLAAELAHNSWSESVQVTLAGFGQEMARMHPDRLTHVDDPVAAVARLRQQRQAVTRAAEQAGTDVLQGRSRGIAGDAWTPQVLLIAPTERTPGDADTAADAHHGGVDELTGSLAQELTAATARSAVALVVAGSDDHRHEPGGRWHLRIDRDGVLTVPALGVSLLAQQIPADEAAQLAQLLAFAADPTPRQAPTDDTADDPPGRTGSARSGPPDDTDTNSGTGFAGADTTGDTAADRTVGDRAGSVEGTVLTRRPGSVLDGPDRTYLAATATTEADLQVLAPAVPAQVRERVEAADDDLDRDLAAWHDPTDPRPKVTVLGGPVVRAGTSRFSAFTTEIGVYLATARRGGVSIDRYATDLWPAEPDIVAQTTVKSKVRTSISQVRKLFGVNPVTGVDYLPRNGGAAGGEYRLDPDVLVDADLFRRLRIRGLARGRDGLADLHAALDLVQGVPFGTRRPGGYGWLADVALDHEYTAMIVDLAHVVATHHLAVDEPEAAAAAAQPALRAGSSEDTPLLDLVAACHAQGNNAQAEAYVRQIMCNHDADEEEDLPPRTYEVLRRRRWLAA